MDKFVKNLRASSTPSKTHEKLVKKSTKGSKKSPKMI
jgi:hypothetical protein